MYKRSVKKFKIRSIWNSILDKLRYFGDKSSLHGVRFVISTSYLPVYKRLFWLAVLTASGVCASLILLKVLNLYSSNAISYLVETDYLEFDTPFPAVTICEQPNADGVKAYINKYNVPATYSLFLKDVSFWSSKFCKTCPMCRNNTCPADFIGAIGYIRRKCSAILTNCWWNKKPFSCCDRFLPMHTEYGICFVFNSRLTGNESIYSVNRRIGLPYLEFSAIEEVGIRTHSPEEMVSVGMENVLGRRVIIPMISDFEVILKAEQTISDKSISTMSPLARGCLYRTEKPNFENWPFQYYSHSACMLYCRALKQMEFCNCTHHLMPKMCAFPYCDVQGLTCLNKHTDSLGSVECECPMSCEEVEYKLVHIFSHRHSGKPSPELSARGTRGIVKLGQLPASRVRRDAIRHTLGLVVDIGGVGGVFFGASLLNVLEIIYLLCIRRRRQEH